MANNSFEEEGFLHAGKDTEEVQKIIAEIEKCKVTFASLQAEIDKLEEDRQKSDNLTGMYQSKAEKLQSKISQNQQALILDEESYQNTHRIMQDEYLELNEKIKDMKEEIDCCKRTIDDTEKVCLSGMERELVFKGNIADSSSSLHVKHQIRYPVNGGSALITFKEQSVAAQVITDTDHTVNIEGTRIYVKAEPVELLVLDAICMEMSVSKTKILVYNLPTDRSEEAILDKLELYFSKPKIGGGEVEKREFLSDCWCVILTFAQKSVVSRLLQSKSFMVPFGNSSTHQVFVAPSLDGNLQNYKMKKLMCNRTVLLTGIPDITEKDNLQVLLELHFHKVSNDGVQALMYCPTGESDVAIFEDDQDDPDTAE